MRYINTNIIAIIITIIIIIAIIRIIAIIVIIVIIIIIHPMKHDYAHSRQNRYAYVVERPNIHCKYFTGSLQDCVEKGRMQSTRRNGSSYRVS